MTNLAPSVMKSIHHRSGLIYDKKLTVIEQFWHAWQGSTMLVGASIGDAFHVYRL